MNNFQFYLALVIMFISLMVFAAYSNASDYVYSDVEISGEMEKDIERGSIQCMQILLSEKYEKGRFIGFLINFDKGTIRIFFEGIREKEATNGNPNTG